jgi:ribosome biogenesis GTPase A
MSKPYVIVPLGGAGVGKSTLCNFLLSGKDSGKFKSSKTTDGGETKEVISHGGKALGKANGKSVKIFDTPGLADPDQPIQQWADEVRKGISSD